MSSTENVQKDWIEPFDPVWWAPQGHLQTIIASQFSTVQQVSCDRVFIDTPDDDFLEADLNILPGDGPVVALFHGLEGSSRRYYIRNLMQDLENEGFSSAALNFRGCGDKLNRKPIFYHSGATYDYRTFFSYIEQHYPGRDIYAVGFSLGANALVKYLGEEGNESLVKKAAVVSPPYDLKEGSLQLQEGINHLYEIYFLRSLVDKLEQKQQIYPDIPTFDGSTLYEFDDQVTAPLHGFIDADDYYHQCSSKHFYEGIRVPTLVLHSKDDSLCPVEYAPLTVMEQSEHIYHYISRYGGHMGFLSSRPGWLNRVLLKWLNKEYR